MPIKRPKISKTRRRTIKSLNLNLDAARAGRTWELLPKPFTQQEDGMQYPLPTSMEDLQIIATIPIPVMKRDCGAVYIRRAIKEWKKRQRNVQSAIHDTGARRQQCKKAQENFVQLTRQLRKEAREEVKKVQEEAVQAIASLSDLFALGRKGIEGQMKAHLDGTEWKGEQINATAFRACFRMVTQAVKGLGLPSDQRKPASDAVIEEAAAALKATQGALAMSASNFEPEEGELN